MLDQTQETLPGHALNRLQTALLCSGAGALLLEAIWFRQLGWALGNTVLAGAATLAAFMLGLALGAARVYGLVIIAGVYKDIKDEKGYERAQGSRGREEGYKRQREARGQRPEARGQRPEARGQRLEARGQRLEARG